MIKLSSEMTSDSLSRAIRVSQDYFYSKWVVKFQARDS